MKQLWLAIAIGAALSGCKISDGTNGDTVVFEPAGSVQCGSSGMSLEQSANKLTSAGLEVVRSACGIITGVVRPAVCGGQDGKIILHQIRSINLKTAQVLGFQAASVLQNPATGQDYERVDCKSGAVVQ